MSILDELKWRGLVADCTDEVLFRALTEPGPITLYAGFDPTADSLHVGNLVPLLALRRFQLLGHKPIALAGGATGLVGDPSGKTQERQLLTKTVLKQNIASVKEQLKRLLDFNTEISNPAQLLDNADWLGEKRYLDFLREVGKYFTVNKMIAKESVRSRMEDREVGITYTEFSYMLLQAYDFFHLCHHHNCLLQIGGSDQWGNITAGIELCHRKGWWAGGDESLEPGTEREGGKRDLRNLPKSESRVVGLTLPLITNADGSKFGKTEAGAIWLDTKRTSVYRFYQFWINTDDRDVIRYLKFFTFLTREEISALEKQHAENPGAREAHKALAKAVTGLIHGEQRTKQAEIASRVLFGGLLDGIEEATFNELLHTDDFDEKRLAMQDAVLEKASGEIPRVVLEESRFKEPGILLVDAIVLASLSSSKGQARKDIEGGGIYINNVREADIQKRISWKDLLFGKHLLLRKGKKNYVVITAI